MRFGPRGPSEEVRRRFPPVCLGYVAELIDQEGLGKRRTGTRQLRVYEELLKVTTKLPIS